MVDTREPPAVREHEALVRMGLLAVICLAVVMALATLFVFTHRPHTPELVPGQKQPSAIAWLDPAQPS